jgi:hypothetical protein
MIGVAADDNACLTVAGEQNTEPARIEMERVGDSRTRQRMPSDNKFVRQPLQPVRGLDRNAAQSRVVEQSPYQVLLVVMRDANGDIDRAQIRQHWLVFAAAASLPREHPKKQIPNQRSRGRVGGQHRCPGQQYVGPTSYSGLV